MINKSSRIFGITVLILWFLFLSLRSQAQHVVQQGNNFVEQSDSTTSGGATKTAYTYTDKHGNVDTIYLSKNGSAFIWKVSKKSGKRYRKYLPEITKRFESKKQGK